MYGRRAFPAAGPTVWNSLPDKLRNLAYDVDSFVRLHFLKQLCSVFSRPYLSNGRAIGMVVVVSPSVCLSVCPSVTDVLWLSLTARPHQNGAVINSLYHCRHCARDRQYECDRGISGVQRIQQTAEPHCKRQLTCRDAQYILRRSSDSQLGSE